MGSVGAPSGRLWKDEAVAELFHVGLTVTELGRSLAFYRDVVGLEVLSTVDVDSEGFRRLTANPEATLRTSLLAAGSFQLQLVEYRSGGGARLELDHRHAGAPHLSFWVDGLGGLRDRLLGVGVTVTSEIESVVPGIRSFYVSDPDGVPVEFIERPS